VLTFQISKQITDFNNILHPELVHLNVSTVSNHKMTGVHPRDKECGLEML
jgi:hypothetical protein